MRRETVTLIMPTFNRCALIGETLEALFAQTRPIDQIIVVDDGSSDGTPQLLEKYKHQIEVHRQVNSGKAVALNNGLSKAIGSLIWVMDDDDIPIPEACSMLVAPLEADTELGYVAGRHIDFEVDPKTGERNFRDPGYMRESQPDRLFPDLLEGCHVFQPGLIVRKEIYEDVGPFDENMIRSQDYEMILRIARSHRGMQLPDVVFFHREHQGARGNAQTQFKADQNADRWAEYNARIFAPLMNDLEDHQLFGQSEWQATSEVMRPRLAHITRGTVFARQRMWPEALDAFEKALELSAQPLSESERRYLARATLSTLGCPELLENPDLRNRTRKLRSKGKAGREMRAIIKRSLMWRLKSAILKQQFYETFMHIRFAITA